jgi:long-chain fatty acid transport protein
MSKAIARLVSGLALCGAGGLARAGGESIPDNGAQPLSRGGTFAAKADDLTAIDYNVAGLALLRGTHLQISTNFIMPTADFTRAGTYMTAGAAYDGAPYPKVSNSAGVFPAPMLLASSDFGLRRITFFAGAYGPSGVGHLSFPQTVEVGGATAPGPSRYDLTKKDLLVFFPTTAVAYRITDKLSVGAAFHWVYAHIEFDQTAYLPAATCGTGQENPRCDLLAHLKATEPFAPSGSVGILYSPTPNWAFGANVHLQTSIDATGTLTVDTAADAPIRPTYDPGRNDADLELTTTLPTIVKAGGRYIFRSGAEERADIELDFTWENWSVADSLAIKIKHITPEPSRPLSKAHGFGDTYSVRLGGAYNWDTRTGMLSARGGVLYDSASSPDAWTHLDFLAWDHIGVAGGAGWRYRDFTVDAGAAYLYMPKKEVSTSSVRQTDALGSNTTGNPDFTTIGNGTYEAGYFILTASVGYTFR